MNILSWCCSRVFWYISYGGSVARSKYKNPLINFTPIFTRHLRVNSFLLENDMTDVRSTKKKNKKFGRITKGDDSEAKISAEHSGLLSELNESENSKITPLPDKYADSNTTNQNKKKQKDIKIFKVKNNIDCNDLLIKIDRILKCIEKGQKVIIQIKGEENSNFDEALNVLNNSKLKEFFINTTKSPTKVNVLFGLSKAKEKKNKVEDGKQ